MRFSVNLCDLQKVYRQLPSLLNWFYPPLCTLCDAPGMPGIDICNGCHADLPWNHPACLRCALPLPGEARSDAICGACLNPGHKVAYDQAWATFIYKDTMPWLITHLKFNKRLNHSRLLGQLMWQQLAPRLYHRSANRPDLMMPLPLHKARLRERGFNQALEIARPIASKSGIKLETGTLFRSKNTERQSDLSLKARRRNLKDAFNCRRSVNGQHVALIDDVMTSGSTVNAAAYALKQAGARRVSVWVTARAALHAI